MKRITRILLGALMIGSSALSFAAPAPGRPQQITQPDGSVVTLTLTGDEFFHCFLTEEGYVVKACDDGFYRYVDNAGQVTEAIVGQGVPASIDINLSFSAYKKANTRRDIAKELNTRAIARIDKLGNSKFDNTDGHDLREVSTEGELRALVILAEFQNEKFSVGNDPKQTISDMLNKPGFDVDDSTGSVFDYYHTVSCGQFSPKFDVYGPVVASKNHIDYVKGWGETFEYEGYTCDVHAPGRLVEECIQALDGEIDFTKYDTNGDGMVDFVYIFHAGKGATTEPGGTNKYIWPHAFTLTSAIGGPIEADGVSINRYVMSCELNGRKLMGAGMFCHEFGHVLGIPDLYDTTNNGTVSKCFTPGTFDNMDGGNYNNDAHTPPTFSGYERYALEWMLPVTLDGSADITLIPLTSRNFAYKVPTQNAQEYYILEARAPHSNDKYIEGHGLAVWHIDFNYDIWQGNKVNIDPDHQRLDLVEADYTMTASSRNGDLFPGTQGVHEFTANVQPTFQDWNRRPVGIELTNIRHNPDGTVTFKASGSKKADGFDIEAPAPVVERVDATSADIAWKPVEGAESYMISVYDLDSMNGAGYYTEFLDGYCFRELGKKAYTTIEGLKPGVNYGVSVYALNSKNASRSENYLTVTAVDNDFEKARPNVYVNLNENGKPELRWDNVNDATHYLVTVATRSAGEQAETVATDFADKKLPAGWSTTAAYCTRAKYVGAASPSLQFAYHANNLKTSVYDREIKSLTFWNKIPFAEENCSLDIFGRTADGARYYISSLREFSTAGSTVTVDIPAGYHSLELAFNCSVTGYNIYIDDLEIALADGPKDTPVSGYDARKETVNALELTGLDDSTEYVAYVQPVKGEAAGLRSHALTFMPGKAVSSVDEAVADFDANEPCEVFNALGQHLGTFAPSALTDLPSGIYILRQGSASRKVAL